jgi:hypothetical protein
MAKQEKTTPQKPAQGRSSAKKEPQPQPAVLKGWKQIAEFLGQPVAVAQRWAGEGMPVIREGRYVETTPDQLSRWLGRESGTNEPVRIATDDSDLSGDLKRGLSMAKREHKRH